MLQNLIGMWGLVSQLEIFFHWGFAMMSTMWPIPIVVVLPSASSVLIHSPNLRLYRSYRRRIGSWFTEDISN